MINRVFVFLQGYFSVHNYFHCSIAEHLQCSYLILICYTVL